MSEHFRLIAFNVFPLPSALFPSVFATFDNNLAGTSVALHVVHENIHHGHHRAAYTRLSFIVRFRSDSAINAEATNGVRQRHAAHMDARRR